MSGNLGPPGEKEGEQPSTSWPPTVSIASAPAQSRKSKLSAIVSGATRREATRGGDPVTRPPVGASAEVLEHHAASHKRDCGPDIGAVERICPWGNILVWQCKRCGEGVFWTYEAWCEHAAELWASVQ